MHYNCAKILERPVFSSVSAGFELNYSPVSGSSCSVTVAPVSTTSALEYRPAIDGLRAIAVLAVFIFHLNRKWLPGGFVGVDIFFVLSGYLITSIILRDCDRNRFTFGRFYQRRIARLLAAFFTVALATLIGTRYIYSSQDFASAGATLSAAAGSIANLKFMLLGNYFVLSPDAQPFLHCWSLSVEEQFYLLFPATFVLLYRYADRHRLHILASLLAISLLLSIVLTRSRPNWAFFLLPTRAWELLAGGILATLKRGNPTKSRILVSIPFIGLALIALSFLVMSEGPTFPGYLAMLPVVGTACFLIPYDISVSPIERILSREPLALIGRMSYSLYLWHWPVFSLVDYRFYLASPLFRLVLKVLLSTVATAICFFFIEKPSRKLLNHPSKQRLALACLGCSLLILVPLGILVRKENYVSPAMSDVSKGGLRFNEGATNGSIVLMGDSNGSMYGKMTKDLAATLNSKLTVISVDGEDPLPHSVGQNPLLWIESLALVKREQPDFLILACLWSVKLKSDEDRLAIALSDLKHYAHMVILITQPPELPKRASRESMRGGARPPFIEELEEGSARLDFNRFLKAFQGDNVRVIDIERLFSSSNGSINFTDNDGNQLYQDSDHLSGFGANLVRAELVKVMRKPRAPL